MFFYQDGEDGMKVDGGGVPIGPAGVRAHGSASGSAGGAGTGGGSSSSSSSQYMQAPTKEIDSDR